ncbi:MAG: type IV toxin-antitoxin system AbiEi family antitoxin domain-containing protein [Acidimicrobiales bacterium]
MRTPQHLAEVFTRQHGVISRQQALQADATRHQIDRRVASGEWHRLSHGVYRHHLAPDSWASRLMAACLTVDGVASHRSAIRNHGVRGHRSPRIEVSIEQGRWRAPGDFALHQTTQIDRIDMSEVDGIPTTGLARSVLDFAGVSSLERTNALIDVLLVDRRLKLGDLADVLVRHSRKGRDGCGRLRTVLDERLGETAVPKSEFSRLVARLLVAHGLPQPEFEFEINDGAGLVGFVDLAYPDERIAIELDSVRWHLNRLSFERDPVRRNRVVNRGWTPLSFTWQAYYERPIELVTTVATARRRLLKAG